MKAVITFKYLNLQDKACHIIVNCQINDNKNLTLLIDTGASNSVFDIDHPAFVSIQKEPLPSENISSGFNSNIDNIFIGVIDLIKFKKFKTSIEPALFTSLEHVNSIYSELNLKPLAGIIGCDFLKKNNAIINFKEKFIELSL